MGHVAALEFHEFEPLVIAGEGDNVLATISLDATVKATGKGIRDYEVRVWTFATAGKMTSLRHVIETLEHYEAHKS